MNQIELDTLLVSNCPCEGCKARALVKTAPNAISTDVFEGQLKILTDLYSQLQLDTLDQITREGGLHELVEYQDNPLLGWLPTQVAKCDCGASSVNSTNHSNWCSKTSPVSNSSTNNTNDTDSND